MSKTVRVGLVGAGFAAAFHLRSYRQVQGVPVEIGAIVDVDKARAENLARGYGVSKCYQDYRQLLDDKSIDIVDLVVPNALHLPMVLQAAEANKHIICEKPLAGYFGQGEADEKVGSTPKKEMLKKVREDLKKVEQAMAAHPAVKFCYAENWVHAPAFKKAIELIEKCISTGAILEMRGEESHSGSHAPYAKW
jgi:predicted dehydrogenase